MAGNSNFSYQELLHTPGSGFHSLNPAASEFVPSQQVVTSVRPVKNEFFEFTFNLLSSLTYDPTQGPTVFRYLMDFCRLNRSRFTHGSEIEDVIQLIVSQAIKVSNLRSSVAKLCTELCSIDNLPLVNRELSDYVISCIYDVVIKVKRDNIDKLTSTALFFAEYTVNMKSTDVGARLFPALGQQLFTMLEEMVEKPFIGVLLRTASRILRIVGRDLDKLAATDSQRPLPPYSRRMNALIDRLKLAVSYCQDLDGSHRHSIIDTLFFAAQGWIEPGMAVPQNPMHNGIDNMANRLDSLNIGPSNKLEADDGIYFDPITHKPTTMSEFHKSLMKNYNMSPDQYDSLTGVIQEQELGDLLSLGNNGEVDEDDTSNGADYEADYENFLNTIPNNS